MFEKLCLLLRKQNGWNFIRRWRR